MPKLPTITSQVSATQLRTNGGGTGTRASAEAFGAGIGRAMQGFAAGVDDLGAGLAVRQEKKRNETVANSVAQSDFTARELEIRNEVPADGTGYQERVLNEYDAYVDEQANAIDDDIARTEYKNRMMAQRPTMSSRAAQYQFTLDATHSKEQADASVMALQNKIMTDPTMYDTYVEQGIAVIDTRTDINANLRSGMKLKWRQDSAQSRFMGMLERAKSVEDIDNVAAELTGTNNAGLPPDERKDWMQEFNPADFQRTVNLIGTARQAFVTKADADARAALDTVQDRAKDVNTLIPQEELAAVQQVVKQSQNPITVARMARVMRDQAIIKESRNLPPAELRGRINATNGNPGIAYPGMPPQISSAINTAVGKFDVSASYLGGTIQREYGQFLKGSGAKGKPEFKPTAVHGGVDLRNVRNDVADAATVAGELFGQPLQVTSGYRSQGKQDAIRARGNPNRPSVAKESHHTSGTGLDISTVGMSAEDKARLAGSLVDAGFTGIGEYDTHIHADMRGAVPASFGDRDGKTWGGWTYLSPEVAQSLKDRGFGPGLSAEQIKRAAPVSMAGSDIDFGRGTTILKDDGRPASSATGVMQFTDGTFLETIKRDGVATRIGVDITDMSDEQLLELRKDPYVATMAGAALAENNKHTLQNTLGRSVNDAEVYMAHFMGAGGATSFLTALKNNPEQSAANLLPKAAEDHKKIFYDGKRPLSVREVHSRISTEFYAAPSQVAHGDNETRQRVLQNAEKQLTDDPMAYAQSTGTFTLSALDAATGFQSRGQEARAIAEFYSIPVTDIKPFTQDEMRTMVTTMKDGSADDVLEIMTAIQAMGGDVSKAAYKQLDQEDSVYAYAAGLQFEMGQSAVASDVIRGQKRIEENPDIKNGIGAEPRDLYDAFTKATGGSLLDVAPSQRQAIQDAALAHYVETVVGRSATTGFDQDAFTNSVQAVLGGTQGAPAVAEVNGQATVLPRGLTGEVMETALKKMTVDDWTQLSDQKLPPRYVTGEVMAPDDLAEEAVMRPIGGGKYKIMLDDGTYAITGRTGQNGRVEAYIFTPDPNKVKQIASRPVAVEPVVSGPIPRDDLIDSDGTLSIDEQQRLRENYGVLHQFDESGRWIGPAK